VAWQLKGGARVLYGKQGRAPLVSLLLVVPRGAETDPIGKEGLTSLTADLLDEGAGKLGALALSEKLEALATDLQMSAYTDGVVLSMNLIAENFGRSVDLLADMVRRPRFEEKEFQRRKAQLIAQAIAAEADPQYGRLNALYRGLFGTGYAGGLSQGTPDSLKAIGHADVKAHYQRLMAAEGATFVVTGGIEREAVAKELERAFGDWAGRPSTEARPLVPSPPMGKLYLVNYTGAAQSAIGVVRRVPGADATDLFPSMVFNRSFGEAFTSRVNLNLREDKGYTYGATSVLEHLRQVGIFGIFSDVRSDVTRASLDEILRELADVCSTRPIVAQERDDSVHGLLLGYPARFGSVSLLAGRFSEIPLQDRPLDWFERWPGRVAAVTLEQANEAARSYCRRSDFDILVAGDAAQVAPTLDGIGFELIRVDARGAPL
jgi:zinc protease